ncbi:MAG: hypothetical protein ACQEXJ_21795 [Myxococcota bacterium]
MRTWPTTPRRVLPSILATWLMAALALAPGGCDGDGDGGTSPPIDAGDDVADAQPDAGPDVSDVQDADADTAADAEPDAGPDVSDVQDADADAVADADTAADADDGSDGSLTFRWSFDEGEQGWEADKSDYSVIQEDTVAFEGSLTERPGELDTEGTAWLLGGTNVSDDLFMFLKREVDASDGLEPNTLYTLAWTMRLASDAQSGCAGIGGAPGESVYLKAGASPDEPTPFEDDGFITIDLDKANQSQGGAEASVAGDIANGVQCGEQPEGYVEIQREHEHTHAVATDDQGRLWLVVGTDSGFEGRTELYYLELEVTLTPFGG